MKSYEILRNPITRKSPDQPLAGLISIYVHINLYMYIYIWEFADVLPCGTGNWIWFGCGAVRCDAELCVHVKKIHFRSCGFKWAVDMPCDGVACRGVRPPAQYGF